MGLFDNSQHACLAYQKSVEQSKEIDRQAATERFGVIGKILADIRDSLRQPSRWVQELQVWTNGETTFGKRGLKYNGVYVADGGAGVKLTVATPGSVSYTVTLAAGFNQLNIPDEATIVTQTAGASVNVLVCWSDYPLTL